MRTFLAALAVSMTAGITASAEPVKLTDVQMDKVSAGLISEFLENLPIDIPDQTDIPDIPLDILSQIEIPLTDIPTDTPTDTPTDIPSQ